MELTGRVAAGSLVLACDAALAPLGRDVLRTLEQRDAQQPALVAGSRVQFGWSVLTLVPDGDALRVFAPDYARDPMRDLDRSLDVTLSVILRQTSLLRELGASGLDARFDSFVIMARDTGTDGVFLRRQTPTQADDSGWSMGNLDDPPSPDDTAAFDAVRVYTLLRLRPAVIPLLALPPEWFVAMRGERIERIVDDAGRVRSGSTPHG